MVEMAAVQAGGMWSMGGPMWMPTRPPTLARILAFHLQPVPIVPTLGVIGLVLYLATVILALRRGHRWPAHHTAAWVLGIVVTEAATTTGIEGYGMMIFSVHMAQHMLLALIVPILLALGAPARLVRTALPGDSTPRRALDALSASRVAAFGLSTPVRWTLFLGSLYGIYFTPLFGSLMHTVWGHTVMLAHFLLTGCLFFGPLISPSAPRDRGAPRRLAATVAGAPLHAVFGLTILLAQHPVVQFFDHPHPCWHVHVLADQSAAGAIAWATSEAATVLVMVVIGADAARTLRAGRSARTDPATATCY